MDTAVKVEIAKHTATREIIKSFNDDKMTPIQTAMLWSKLEVSNEQITNIIFQSNKVHGISEISFRFQNIRGRSHR